MHQPQIASPANSGGFGSREEEREIAFYLPILIRSNAFSGFCLLRNLSSNGMMGVVFKHLPKGAPIEIEFGHELFGSGTVVWSKDGRIGVRFDQKIDMQLATRVLGQKTVNKLPHRAPRLRLKCAGQLDIDGRKLRFELHDISQKGMRSAIPLVRLGEKAQVELDGLAPHKAEVRWVKKGLAGFSFFQPLSFAELAQWAVMQQGRPAATGRNPAPLASKLQGRSQ